MKFLVDNYLIILQRKIMENIDEKIQQQFNIVKLKREKFEKAEAESKQPWKTTCSITINNLNSQNIQLASIQKIKEILIGLLMQQKFSLEAHTLLGLENDNKYQNFSYDDWISDCIKRASMISLKQEKETLNELENRLNAILSTEQRRLMELESISASLKL